MTSLQDPLLQGKPLPAQQENTPWANEERFRALKEFNDRVILQRTQDFFSRVMAEGQIDEFAQSQFAAMAEQDSEQAMETLEAGVTFSGSRWRNPETHRLYRDLLADAEAAGGGALAERATGLRQRVDMFASTGQALQADLDRMQEKRSMALSQRGPGTVGRNFAQSLLAELTFDVAGRTGTRRSKAIADMIDGIEEIVGARYGKEFHLGMTPGVSKLRGQRAPTQPAPPGVDKETYRQLLTQAVWKEIVSEIEKDPHYDERTIAGLGEEFATQAGRYGTWVLPVGVGAGTARQVTRATTRAARRPALRVMGKAPTRLAERFLEGASPSVPMFTAGYAMPEDADEMRVIEESVLAAGPESEDETIKGDPERLATARAAATEAIRLRRATTMAAIMPIMALGGSPLTGAVGRAVGERVGGVAGQVPGRMVRPGSRARAVAGKITGGAVSGAAFGATLPALMELADYVGQGSQQLVARLGPEGNVLSRGQELGVIANDVQLGTVGRMAQAGAQGDAEAFWKEVNEYGKQIAPAMAAFAALNAAGAMSGFSAQKFVAGEQSRQFFQGLDAIKEQSHKEMDEFVDQLADDEIAEGGTTREALRVELHRVVDETSEAAEKGVGPRREETAAETLEREGRGKELDEREDVAEVLEETDLGRALRETQTPLGSEKTEDVPAEVRAETPAEQATREQVIERGIEPREAEVLRAADEEVGEVARAGEPEARPAEAPAVDVRAPEVPAVEAPKPAPSRKPDLDIVERDEIERRGDSYYVEIEGEQRLVYEDEGRLYDEQGYLIEQGEVRAEKPPETIEELGEAAQARVDQVQADMASLKEDKIEPEPGERGRELLARSTARVTRLLRLARSGKLSPEAEQAARAAVRGELGYASRIKEWVAEGADPSREPSRGGRSAPGSAAEVSRTLRSSRRRERVASRMAVLREGKFVAVDAEEVERIRAKNEADLRKFAENIDPKKVKKGVRERSEGPRVGDKVKKARATTKKTRAKKDAAPEQTDEIRKEVAQRGEDPGAPAAERAREQAAADDARRTVEGRVARLVEDIAGDGASAGAISALGKLIDDVNLEGGDPFELIRLTKVSAKELEALQRAGYVAIKDGVHVLTELGQRRLQEAKELRQQEVEAGILPVRPIETKPKKVKAWTKEDVTEGKPLHLSRAFKAVSRAVAAEETRFAIDGVFYDAKNGTLTATDGRRLFTLRIGEGALGDTSRVLAVDGGRDLENRFPDYEGVIPKNPPHTVEIDVKHLLALSQFTKLWTKSLGSEVASGRVVIIDNADGEIRVMLDASYVEDMARFFADLGVDRVQIKYDDENVPILVESADGVFRAVQMPLTWGAEFRKPIAVGTRLSYFIADTAAARTKIAAAAKPVEVEAKPPEKGEDKPAFEHPAHGARAAAGRGVFSVKGLPDHLVGTLALIRDAAAAMMTPRVKAAVAAAKTVGELREALWTIARYNEDGTFRERSLESALTGLKLVKGWKVARVVAEAAYNDLKSIARRDVVPGQAFNRDWDERPGARPANETLGDAINKAAADFKQAKEVGTRTALEQFKQEWMDLFQGPLGEAAAFYGPARDLLAAIEALDLKTDAEAGFLDVSAILGGLSNAAARIFARAGAGTVAESLEASALRDPRSGFTEGTTLWPRTAGMLRRWSVRWGLANPLTFGGRIALDGIQSLARASRQYEQFSRSVLGKGGAFGDVEKDTPLSGALFWMLGATKAQTPQGSSWDIGPAVDSRGASLGSYRLLSNGDVEVTFPVDSKWRSHGPVTVPKAMVDAVDQVQELAQQQRTALASLHEGVRRARDESAYLDRRIAEYDSRIADVQLERDRVTREFETYQEWDEYKTLRKKIRKETMDGDPHDPAETMRLAQLIDWVWNRVDAMSARDGQTYQRPESYSGILAGLTKDRKVSVRRKASLQDYMTKVMDTWGFRTFHHHAIRPDADARLIEDLFDDPSSARRAGDVGARQRETMDERLGVRTRAHAGINRRRRDDAESLRGRGLLAEDAIISLHDYFLTFPLYVERAAFEQRHSTFLYGELTHAQEVQRTWTDDQGQQQTGTFHEAMDEHAEVVYFDKRAPSLGRVVALIDEDTGQLSYKRWRDMDQAERDDWRDVKKRQRRRASLASAMGEEFMEDPLMKDMEGVLLWLGDREMRPSPEQLADPDWVERNLTSREVPGGFQRVPNLQFVSIHDAREHIRLWRDGWYGKTLEAADQRLAGNEALAAHTLARFIEEQVVGGMREAYEGVRHRYDKGSQTVEMVGKAAQVWESVMSLMASLTSATAIGGPTNIRNAVQAGLGGLAFYYGAAGRYGLPSLPSREARHGVKAYGRLEGRMRGIEGNALKRLWKTIRGQRANVPLSEVSVREVGRQVNVDMMAELNRAGMLPDEATANAVMGPNDRTARELASKEAVAAAYRMNILGGNRGDQLIRNGLMAVMAPFGDRRRFRNWLIPRHGRRSALNIWSAANDFFWAPFNVAERYARLMPWIDVYVDARAKGASRQDATDRAFAAVHNSQLIYTRASKARVLNSVIGRPVTALATWSIHAQQRVMDTGPKQYFKLAGKLSLWSLLTQLFTPIDLTRVFTSSVADPDIAGGFPGTDITGLAAGVGIPTEEDPYGVDPKGPLGSGTVANVPLPMWVTGLGPIYDAVLESGAAMLELLRGNADNADRIYGAMLDRVNPLGENANWVKQLDRSFNTPWDAQTQSQVYRPEDDDSRKAQRDFTWIRQELAELGIDMEPGPFLIWASQQLPFAAETRGWVVSQMNEASRQRIVGLESRTATLREDLARSLTRMKESPQTPEGAAERDVHEAEAREYFEEIKGINKALGKRMDPQRERSAIRAAGRRVKIEEELPPALRSIARHTSKAAKTRAFISALEDKRMYVTEDQARRILVDILRIDTEAGLSTIDPLLRGRLLQALRANSTAWKADRARRERELAPAGR